MPAKLTTEQFIERARAKHANWYDYSLVEYAHSKIPVKIICHKHGEFLQKPEAHLNTKRPCGCPVCGSGGTPEERFWGFVDKRNEKECWNWLGYIDEKGYGTFRYKKMMKAHVFSYLLNKGEIPIDNNTVFGRLFVCHHCDNPSCVNPYHLFLGNNSDNLMDASRKGRLPDMRGENAPNAKLTWDKVRLIRRLRNEKHYSQKELGEMFGVTQTNIGTIVRGKTWKE